MPLYTYTDAGALLRINYAADGSFTTTIVSALPLPSPAPATSGQGIIISAMRLCGQVAAGEIPTADELADGLIVLNQMIDGWNTERLMIPGLQATAFSLTAGKQPYTLGSGGDFNMERPPQLEGATLRITSALEVPLYKMADSEWAAVGLKTLGNTYPGSFWDDGGFPLRTLSFWPIPTSGMEVVLWTWQPVSQFIDLTTAQSFPPGYVKALRYNLAVDLAAEFEGQLSPIVAAIAGDAKGKIKRLNYSSPPRMTADCPLGRDTVGYVDRAAFLSGGLT